MTVHTVFSVSYVVNLWFW